MNKLAMGNILHLLKISLMLKDFILMLICKDWGKLRNRGLFRATYPLLLALILYLEIPLLVTNLIINSPFSWVLICIY